MVVVRRLAAIAVVFMFLVGCGEKRTDGPRSNPPSKSTVDKPQNTPPNPIGPIMKVAVMRDGKIFVNGEASSLSALREAFGKLAEQHGAVMYYREAGNEEPHPAAMEVIKTVVEAKLPIMLCRSPDFSDPVGNMKPPE